MIPHERSLVAKFADQPFVLLGINSDKSREDLQKQLAEQQMTWRNWFDGSTAGPIATAWNVHSWPTTYLIDAEGIIRCKGGVTDEAIASLLAKMTAKKPTGKKPLPKKAAPKKGGDKE